MWLFRSIREFCGCYSWKPVTSLTNHDYFRQRGVIAAIRPSVLPIVAMLSPGAHRSSALELCRLRTFDAYSLDFNRFGQCGEMGTCLVKGRGSTARVRARRKWAGRNAPHASMLSQIERCLLRKVCSVYQAYPSFNIFRRSTRRRGCSYLETGP